MIGRRLLCAVGIHRTYAGAAVPLLGPWDCDDCNPRHPTRGCRHSDLADCVREGCGRRSTAPPPEAIDDTELYLRNRKAFWLFPDRWADGGHEMLFDDGTWQPPPPPEVTFAAHGNLLSIQYVGRAQISSLQTAVTTLDGRTYAMEPPPPKKARSSLGHHCRQCMHVFTAETVVNAVAVRRPSGGGELLCCVSCEANWSLSHRTRELTAEEAAAVAGYSPVVSDGEGGVMRTYDKKTKQQLSGPPLTSVARRCRRCGSTAAANLGSSEDDCYCEDCQRWLYDGHVIARAQQQRTIWVGGVEYDLEGRPVKPYDPEAHQSFY